MNESVLLAKVAVGLAAIGGWLVLDWTGDRRSGRPAGRFEIAGLWLLTRPILFIAAFGFAGLDVSSDVPRFYLPQAREVLAGGVPYRDFVSSYGPLFPVIAALPVALWNTGASIVALAIVWEAVALAAWSAVARRARSGIDSTAALRLYLCHPLPMLNVVLLGQNQIWIGALWGLAAWAVTAGRSAWGGVATALSMIGVKVLGALALPTLFWRAPSRPVFAGAAGLVAVVVVGPLALAGVDVLQPVVLERDQLTSGNIPYLLTWLGVPSGAPGPALVLTLGLALALVSTVVLLERRTGDAGPAAALPTTVSCVLLVLLLASRKAYAGYLVMALVPMSIAFIASRPRRWQGALFLATGALASIEPSLWFRWMAEATLVSVGVPQDPRTALFLTIELLLVAGYAWLLWRLWPRPRGDRTITSAPPPP